MKRAVRLELPAGLDRPDITDRAVLDAMKIVPREIFVPEEYRQQANEDCALPIEFGQTISQPYIVALMTQESKAEKGAKVLEIGTGSGYQAAVLAQMGVEVFSIEYLPELLIIAKEHLAGLGIDSIKLRAGDGWDGWPEGAPFDAILITAAIPRVPEHLLQQLKIGGKLVVPLERPDFWGGEELLVLTRTSSGAEKKYLGAVRFVPLIGKVRK